MRPRIPRRPVAIRGSDRAQSWPTVIVAILVVLAYALIVTALASLARDRSDAEVALGDLREVTLEQDVLHWQARAEGRASVAIAADVATVRARGAALRAGLRLTLAPATADTLDAAAVAYDRAIDNEFAALSAGAPAGLTQDALAVTDAAFVALDTVVEGAEADAHHAARIAGDIQTIGSLATFGASALVLALLFLRYRRRLRTTRHADEAAASRTAAVRALRLVQRQDTLEGTAEKITQALLGLPEVDVAVVFAFVGSADVTVLAVSGPLDYPLRSGDMLPAGRAAYVRERAVHGEWAEPWRPRAADGEYGIRITEAGLQAVGFGPIGKVGDPAGLLVIGTTIGHGRHLVENLPAVNEFAITATVLLGDELAERRDLAAVRARVTSVVARSAFHPVFQPVVHLTNRRTVGFEALTRFEDGQRPDVVFADAARAGVGPQLEEATLRAAVWASRDLAVGAWLSINVSPRFILGDRLRVILRDRTRPIVVELTEHEAIADYAAIRAAVRALGPDVRIAVDDAGAGVANFGHIVELRPDFVKVDASLVRGVNHDLTRQALIAGLRHFTRATNSWLIAEGVETAAESKTLMGLDIELGQGYLFARPDVASSFEERLAGKTPLRAPRKAVKPASVVKTPAEH